MEDLQAIKATIEAMPAHEKLVFAGGLLKAAANAPDARRKLALARTAHVIADRVAVELGAMLALHELETGRLNRETSGG